MSAMLVYSFCSRDLLGHEKDENGGDDSKAVLSAKDGSVRPAAVVCARLVDDEGDGKGSECVGEGGQTGEHTSEGHGSNLLTVN